MGIRKFSHTAFEGETKKDEPFHREHGAPKGPAENEKPQKLRERERIDATGGGR
jgi:hypothetical protein